MDDNDGLGLSVEALQVSDEYSLIRGGVFRHKSPRHQRMAFLRIFLASEGSGNPSIVFRGIKRDSGEVRIVENKAVVVEHCHSSLTTFYHHFPN